MESLQAKGKLSTLQRGKLCYNAININYKSRLSLIVRVNVVLNRTAVVDSD